MELMEDTHWHEQSLPRLEPVMTLSLVGVEERQHQVAETGNPATTLPVVRAENPSAAPQSPP